MKGRITIPVKFIFAAIVIASVFAISIVSARKRAINQVVFTPKSEPEDSSDALQVRPPVFPKEINFCGEATPLTQPDIRERLDRELTINAYMQATAILNMKQTTRWFSQIEATLRDNGIPEDFKYLCMAESGLQQVVSRAGASGFWQFMDETGKRYGLEINDEVDERYNVERATEAACAYLKNAHDELGSWTLAAASYNCGLAGAQKFKSQQKQDNYYDLLLPEETMRYLFRILAMKEIYTHPSRYGFGLESNDFYPPFVFKTIQVSDPIEDLAQFAIDNGTNYKMLKLLNPWLRKPYLKNLKHKIYTIKIPV